MHPVERKLRYEILPFIEAVRRFRTWTPLRIYEAYSYVGEGLILLAGMGIAAPLTKALTQSKPDPGSLAAVLTGGYATAFAVATLFSWGMLKIYIKRENLTLRCSLLTKCIEEFRVFGVQIQQAVALQDPMRQLNEIQQHVSSLFLGCVKGGVPLDLSLPREVDCSDLIANHKDNWKQPPQERMPKPGGRENKGEPGQE